jgi:Tfp pilus assembly protein FimV
MAALTYPISVIPGRSLRLVDPMGAPSARPRGLPWSFQEPARSAPRVASIEERRRRRAVIARRRRLAALFASVAILAATWGISGVLAGVRSSHLAVLPGSVRTSQGYLYTVKPGDSVWSIATRLDPTGDPRPIVDTIVAQLNGASIAPGERVLLP